MHRTPTVTGPARPAEPASHPPPTGDVVVGLDGSDPAGRAVAWAAAEAELRGARLVLAHGGYVVDRVGLTARTAATVLSELTAYGHRLVDDTTASLAHSHPGLDMLGVIRHTAPEDLLIELSHTAALVVMGTHGRGRLASTLLGSVSQRVAAHANSPVVVIPAHEPQQPTEHTVVVGIADTPGGHAALRFAAEEATRHGARLVALRTWGESTWGDGYDFDNFMGWRHDERRLLDHVLTEVRGLYPCLAIDAKLLSGGIVHSLIGLAGPAELLVLGCRRSDEQWPSRLGPIASWLLHRSPCPVAVVGRPHGPTEEAVAAGATVAAQ
jgi:nucleotide-binding universal stress UspA family protein